MGGVGQRYRQLVALSREEGALRAVLARIAAQLVSRRAWERLGYARLGDYAVECLGLAGRSVRCLAEVGTKLHWLPRLEGALISGTLGWTKVRLLAPLPREEDETRWIARARRMSAEDLSRAVGAVDRGSIEGGAAEKEDARCRRFEVRCTPEVRWKWVVARRAAARAAGRMLHVSEAAKLIAAEVLSALPISETAEEAACDEAEVSWCQEADSSGDTVSPEAPPRDEAGPAFRDAPSGAHQADERGAEPHAIEQPAHAPLPSARTSWRTGSPGQVASRCGGFARTSSTRWRWRRRTTSPSAATAGFQRRRGPSIVATGKSVPRRGA